MISVSDMKQYFFCPKVVYFTHVLHVPKFKDTKIEEGKEKHNDITAKEKRRKGAIFYDGELDRANKRFKIPLESEKLGLRGVLDYLIEMSDEYIPVEYKYGYSHRKKAYRNHKYQLLGYVLLVEDNFDTIVRRGFIHYNRDRVNIEILITDSLRKFALKTIVAINDIVEREVEPKGTRHKAKCTDCEYITYCGGA